MMRGWLVFARERFPPSSYLPMLVLFVSGNSAIARWASPQAAAWSGRVMLAAVLALSAFFRLRCFDEVKDYDTDLAINPTRPLPRGVLTVSQVMRVAVALSVVELAVAAMLGGRALAAQAIVVGYSWLMFREFFIGAWLRPRLTTYAVSHTAVSIALGYSVAAIVVDAAPWQLPRAVLGFGLVNWALFNLFEFARKTYAPAEERPRVDTYSGLFGPAGAAALSVSQVVAAVGLMGYLLGSRAAYVALVPAGVFAVVAGAYVVRHEMARVLRASSGAYILAAYGVVLWRCWG